MCHVPANGKPEVLEADAHGTDFLATAAKSAPEDVAAEFFPLLVRGASFPEKPPEERSAALQDLPEAFHAGKCREHPVPRGRNRRANIGT
jgi:hypothetical protein